MEFLDAQYSKAIKADLPSAATPDLSSPSPGPAVGVQRGMECKGLDKDAAEAADLPTVSFDEQLVVSSPCSSPFFLQLVMLCTCQCHATITRLSRVLLSKY